MNDRLFVALQHALPQRALTELAGIVARAQWGALTTTLVRAFIRHYGVDMSQAAQPDPAAYASFNDFFTRALAPGARPMADADWICPVDGAISQMGAIESGRLFQAKGHTYTAQALLAGDAAEAARFHGGHFATLYLSPRDYHRIHMPCAGTLRHMRYVPGALFSVNPATARGVPGLFARNERVVCLFDTDRGALALVLVGATIVGSMVTVWHGVVNSPRRRAVTTWDYADGAVTLGRGAELGRFQLGSTVIVLWPRQPLTWADGWVAQAPVRLGQAMAMGTARTLAPPGGLPPPT